MSDFAALTGEALSAAFQSNISTGILPNGQMTKEIAEIIIREPMTDDYTLISEAAEKIQQELNRAAGIGLKAQRADLDTGRIESMINKIVEYESYDDAAWMLGAPVVTFSREIVDETARKNAEFQSKAGLKTTVRRSTVGKCCEWCSALAGVYDYDEVRGAGNDVWRRHNNCDCLIEFTRDGKKEKVYNYREDNTPEGRARIERRKQEGINLLEREQIASTSITNLRNEKINRSVGAKYQNYDIMDLATGNTYHLAENTYLQDKEVFAGKGTRKPYGKASFYADRYGGMAENWQHVKAKGTLDTPDGDRKAEIHWSQCKDIGKKEMFIKRWLD